MTDHTPTPWTAEKFNRCDDKWNINGPSDNYFLATVYDGNGSYDPAANAAYIVRCVNAHAALVAVVEEFLADQGTLNEPFCNKAICERAEAALELAKA